MRFASTIAPIPRSHARRLFLLMLFLYFFLSLCINVAVVVTFFLHFSICARFLCVHGSGLWMYTVAMRYVYLIFALILHCTCPAASSISRKEQKNANIVSAFSFASELFNYQLIHAHRFSNQFHLMYLR